MALAPPPLVDAAAPITRPHPKNQILWPTFSGYGNNGGSDSGEFPSLPAIKARSGARFPEPLAAFVEAARNAQNRILVLDDYLFEPPGDQSTQDRYKQILCWLPIALNANEIRFLTKAHGRKEQQKEIRSLFNERVEAINKSTPRRVGMAKIEIRFTLGTKFPYVHDRFAIIDNELWHFGATVGGLHNLVNAATRGWDAVTHNAVRFFDDAWNGDNDAQRGGRHG